MDTYSHSKHSPHNRPTLKAADKLQRLRLLMVEQGLSGYLVPHADEFLCEYLPKSAERLSWLTGFTGTNGLALVMADAALVMTDSRYSLQIKQEVDADLYHIRELRDGTMPEWLTEQGITGGVIGFDSALFNVAEIQKLESVLDPLGLVLKPIAGNLIDSLWVDRPEPPCSRVEPFLESFAGASAAQKRGVIAQKLVEADVAAAVLPAPADWAWLLNIRGRDVPHTPLALSCGFIYADGTVEWIIDPARVSPEIQKSLGNDVRITAPDKMLEAVMRLKARAGRASVLVDGSQTNYQLVRCLEDRNIAIKLGQNPVIIPRACKTTAEQNAIRDAHRKDAVALIRFLAWFDENAESGQLDELSVAETLLAFRRGDPAWRDLSFDTIAGMGPNGAIVHYRATEKTNRKIRGDSLLLLDSGAQYAGGTTDVTRTLAVGGPSDEMRTHYTTVLKGHIAVVRAVFPKGTTGIQIDALARAPLWARGLDFAHGTGHGVGCYLGVHEDGPRLSPRGAGALLPGMVVTNEPGYYRAGEYGIRLENVMLVTSVEVAGAEAPMFGFETLTLAPFDPGLTRLSLLDEGEREWLAAYHTRILDEIGPVLDPSARAWLEATVKYFC